MQFVQKITTITGRSQVLRAVIKSLDAENVKKPMFITGRGGITTGRDVAGGY